jgi:formylglycine-generating enzyme
VALVERPERAAPANMAWIPGRLFRMGSDKHYPEEAPVHRVTVSGFWIDRTPVTNRQFKQFVRATGHKTFAEIPPDPKSYPGALPHMLYAGSLVFTPPNRPVDLKNFGEWWRYLRDANWRHPYGPKSNINARDNHRSYRLLRCTGLCQMGGQGAADRSGMGICRARRA